MAKIAIKYEKIIPFGGIFQFSSVLEPVKWNTHEILKSFEKMYLCKKVARKNVVFVLKVARKIVSLHGSRPKKCQFSIKSRPKKCYIKL